MHEFYEPQVLARLQHTELQILKDFMELCDSHGLLYFGIGGTGSAPCATAGSSPGTTISISPCPGGILNSSFLWRKRNLPEGIIF